MGTLKSIQMVILSVLFLTCYGVQGQKLLRKVKKQVEDKAAEVMDEGLNGNKQKSEKEDGRTDEYITASGKSKINPHFIDRSNLLFFDNFDNEKPGEFPSKWTQVDGTVENGHFISGNRKDGVVQMVSSRSEIKPTFDKDDYLGESFKIELEHHFWQQGNEAYVIQLFGSRSSRPAYTIYLRGTNVAPGSESLAYMAGKQSPGWFTSQISFNRGNLKVFVNGQQLVNNPDINIREFTHLSLYTLSPGSTRGDGHTKARINYFMIAKEGLPLYDRIVTNGRIVVRDIYFDVDRYDIKPESYPSLDKIVKMMKEHPNMEVTIEGHTDSNGSNESNLTLSENRAGAVKNYMVSKGIKRYRLASKGFGEEKPVSLGNDENAWAMNRRVEFVLHN
ncbi:OmpA family protein [Flagellimonas sp.]|uniref:OmpA family protein n=1 Tax=Flagellimonas sp. TaxID=2058762 RepID=UPI003B52F3DB